MAQFAPMYGMAVQDINDDGNLDVMISGNDYGNEIVNGHYDALNGLVLLGDGKNNFKPLTIQESGLFIPGDGKGLAQLIVGDRYTLAATQNKGSLKLFGLQKNYRVIRFNKDDVKAVLYLKSGRSRVHEIYHGDSFLSNSARVLVANGSVTSIEVLDKNGAKRKPGF